MTAPGGGRRDPRRTVGREQVRVVRRIGIAIGSLVIAWLALSLVGGVIGLTPASGVLGVLAVVVVGALVYQDIIRRETPSG
jgi:hypothetical protein